MAENLTFNLDVDSSKAVSSINNFFETFDKGAAQAKSKLNSAFNQTLQTEIKVEFKNGKLVAKEVQSLKQESSRLQNVYKAVNGELGKTPNQLKKQKSILSSLLGDTKKFKDGTRELTNEWKALSDRLGKVSKELGKMGTGGGSALSSLATKFTLIQTAANLVTTGVIKLIGQIGELIGTAGRMEVLQLQLEGFTGGAAAAATAFDEFVRIAGNSPLNLEEVAGAAKTMMAFGLSTGDAVKATEQLAIVSAATGGDINLLARNMGQIVAQGRAYTRDLTQFAIQGIPIWDQLSVATGKSVVELKDMATQGMITGKEVSAALELMTAEGTAFAEIAERMQETFQGRMAKIEAAFQNLALKAVNAFNIIDKSVGGPVSNSMKGFAELLNKTAENIVNIGIVATTAAVGLGAFVGAFALAKLATLIETLGGIRSAFGLMRQTIWATVAAKISYLALSGPAGWAQIAAGIGLATVAFVGLKNATKTAADEQLALEGQVDSVTEGTGRLTEAALKYAEKVASKEAVQAYKDQQELVDELSQKIGATIAKLKEQQEEANKNFEAEQKNIQDLIDAEREKIREAEEGMKRAQTAVKDKYDAEKRELQDTLSMVREKYDLEIGALRQKTPSEKALYELQKRKLKSEIQSGKLSGEDLLRAKARLERMTAQEKIAVLQAKAKNEEKTITTKLSELDNKKQKDLDEIAKKFGAYIKAAEKAEGEQKKLLKDSKKAQDDLNRSIDESIEDAEDLGVAFDGSTTAVNDTRDELKLLVQDIVLATGKANDLATALRAKNKAAKDAAADAEATKPSKPSKGVSRSARFRFAGGPVSGGSAYTVNELGKEAFLSASGALSMINAPSFGTWTAPSSGTVIPAHLTKQLNIPKGGVSINKTSGASAASGGGMNMNKMAGMLAEAMGGDNVTNNVTIQSTNPNQTASDVMVQLAKLKRLRYN